MKRIFTLIAAISMVLGAMAQSAGITVSYNKGDSLIFFKSSQIASAIEAALPNDTIYFAPGTYSISYLPEQWGSSYYTRKLLKPLTFIGAGAQSGGTYFENSSISLYIDLYKYKDDAAVAKKVSFEGINFDNGIYVASDLEDLTLRNVYMYNDLTYTTNDTVTAKVNSMRLDRCSLSSVDLGSGRVGKANFNNTKIRSYLYGSCTDNEAAAALDHCYIYYVQNNFNGYIQNSLIYNDNGTSASVMDHCAYYSNGSSEKRNCNKLSSSNVSSLDTDPSGLDTTTYVSTDGTPLGTTGGTTPYSLYPSYPTPDVSSSSTKIEYDAVNKKLNVTIKILGEVEVVEEETPAEGGSDENAE